MKFRILTGFAKVSIKSTTRRRVSTWRVRIALRVPVATFERSIYQVSGVSLLFLSAKHTGKVCTAYCGTLRASRFYICICTR